jgi:anti-sigma-K factor RskA
MTPDLHLLTGAYALHALDDVERRLFERHLAECPDCAQEVEELRATAARLGVAASGQPPSRLKHQVMDRIATTRQKPPNRGTARSSHRWAPRLTTVAAAIALLAAVALGVVAVHTQNQLGAARQQLAQAQARYGPAAAVLAAPDVRSGTASAAGATAIVMVSHQLNEAVLTVHGMPPPAGNHTYQVWLLGSGNPRSAGLLELRPNAVIPPLVFGGIGGATGIGVTQEPAGGSPQPTTALLLRFDLPA